VQRAIERRPELTDGHSIESIRPIFIAADEAQFWATGATDTHFQMTARSARGLTVYSTQSIPNFYSEWEATAPPGRGRSLLGNLQHALPARISIAAPIIGIQKHRQGDRQAESRSVTPVISSKIF